MGPNARGCLPPLEQVGDYGFAKTRSEFSRFGIPIVASMTSKVLTTASASPVAKPSTRSASNAGAVGGRREQVLQDGGEGGDPGEAVGLLGVLER